MRLFAFSIVYQNSILSMLNNGIIFVVAFVQRASLFH